MGRSKARGRGRGHRTPVRSKPKALAQGTIHIVRAGVAVVETPEGSFSVARRGIREAMNGDEVQVSLVPGRGGERFAYVQGVLQRATSTFMGSYAQAGPLGAVTPLDGRMAHDFFVLPDDASAERLGVADGDVVAARILQYPTRNAAGVVTIERRAGAASDLDLMVETVIASHGLATEFTAQALEEAQALTLDVEGALANDALRRDLRGQVVLTIDPTDARDYDDAVSARKLADGGFEVGVHIADVTSYLPWGSSMDIEARQRTCSTYLVDRVLPMLPERLCNDLCSLRPDEDRLAMTVVLQLDAQGNVRASEVFPSVMRSRARLDYATADALLEGRIGAEDLPCEAAVAPAVADAIRLLDEVGALRRAVRARRGAVDFASREAKVELDEAGHPVGVHVRERTRATSLIEEAMLLANEAVAQLLADADVPAAYRVHERPVPEDLAATIPVLQELELLQPGDAERLAAADPFTLQRILARAQGGPGDYLANALLLRAQRRAIYLPHNDGHYALGAKAYCHFTSPIRRYPDVIVHRAVKALLHGTRASREQQAVERMLPQLCRTCSDQERVADDASRDSQKIKMAELYASKVGERFSGIVVGVERYGLFVMLDDTCAEGLLPVRALGDEWFTYSEERLMLMGEESGRAYRLGQRVAVEVVGATPERGQIDFALAGAAAHMR